MLRIICLIAGLTGTAMVAGCAGHVVPERELSALHFRDQGVPIPYADALRPPALVAAEPGLPLPTYDVSLSALPAEGAWMKAYDFNGDAYLSRGEMTQAWLIAWVRWKLGRDSQPSELSVNGRAISGVHITLDAERSVRAGLEALTERPDVGPRIAAALANVNRALALTISGGDSGYGTESKGLDGWEADGALFGPGATD